MQVEHLPLAGSDWKLMAEEVEKQFDSVVERNLDGNRSLRALVEFNNDFFAYASESGSDAR